MRTCHIPSYTHVHKHTLGHTYTRTDRHIDDDSQTKVEIGWQLAAESRRHARARTHDGSLFL